MIVNSIDIQGGSVVQLISGEELALDAGTPADAADWLGVAGELAIIDLDAARGEGSNRAHIEPLLRGRRVRVGGGIRSVQAALDWLDAGADQVILGTAARPELLRQLPRQRVIAAVDARDGEVVVDGWRTRTGDDLLDTVRRLSPYVGGFLVTFVEREGGLGGTDLDRVPELLQAAGDARLTVAGGITTAAEIAALDALGVDAQVGMALYTGRLGLGEALTSCLRSDRPDGLFPTVVCDEGGVALGLCYSSADSLQEAIATRRGVYTSRRRGRWEKGATSGATQRLIRVDVDCDRDALRFVVEQAGAGFCHLERRGCWGPDRGLGGLARRIDFRLDTEVDGSYTRRLLKDPTLLRAKLVEEALELAEADTPDAVTWETADLLYFALTAMVRGGSSLAEVEAELDRRTRRVRRRPGDAKPLEEAS